MNNAFVPEFFQQDERFFNRVFFSLLLTVCCFSMLTIVVDLPEIPRETKEKIPVRFAELILQKPVKKTVVVE